MRGPYQIWAGAFFFTSSSLVSTVGNVARNSSSSLARAKEMDRLGGFKNVCHVRQEVAERAVCTAIFREKMLKFTDSRTTSVSRSRTLPLIGISGVN
jgi:hypothetical protein